MQGAVALPVGEDPTAGREREERAAADCPGGCRVAGVAVEQMGLDEGRADVRGLRVGQQRTDP